MGTEDAAHSSPTRGPRTHRDAVRQPCRQVDPREQETAIILTVVMYRTPQDEREITSAVLKRRTGAHHGAHGNYCRSRMFSVLATVTALFERRRQEVTLQVT